MMKHRRKQLLSVLLTLALMLGLLPGMSLTALADGATPRFSFTAQNYTCSLGDLNDTIKNNVSKINKIEVIVESEGADWAQIQWGYWDDNGAHTSSGSINTSAGVHKSVVEGVASNNEWSLAQVQHHGNGKLWWAKVYFNNNTSVEIGDPNYPEFTVLTDLTATVGQTLADVTLPTVTNGTWSWADSATSVGEVGNKTFNATFTPTDNALHTVTNILVPVTVSAHAHSFTYSASGATITAECTGVGTCGLTDKKATLTIVKPTLTTYGETGKSASATLYGLTDFNTATGLSVSADSISYYIATKSGDAYTKGDAITTGAPTGAGDYLAEITLSGVKTSEGDDKSVTASVGYTIAKAATNITTAPTAGEITYGQTLADSTLTGGEASVAGSFAWKDSTVAPAASDSQTTEYDVVFTPTDGNYSTAECKVKLTVKKAAPAVTAPTAKP